MRTLQSAAKMTLLATWRYMQFRGSIIYTIFPKMRLDLPPLCESPTGSQVHDSGIALELPHAELLLYLGMLLYKFHTLPIIGVTQQPMGWPKVASPLTIQDKILPTYFLLRLAGGGHSASASSHSGFSP